MDHIFKIDILCKLIIFLETYLKTLSGKFTINVKILTFIFSHKYKTSHKIHLPNYYKSKNPTIFFLTRAAKIDSIVRST